MKFWNYDYIVLHTLKDHLILMMNSDVNSDVIRNSHIWKSHIDNAIQMWLSPCIYLWYDWWDRHNHARTLWWREYTVDELFFKFKHIWKYKL